MSTPKSILLRIVESANTAELGREFALQGARFSIGRGKENAVILDDALASRQHAEISVSEGSLVLKDRESANGLWMGDRRIETCELSNKDLFRVGRTVLQVFLSSEVPAATRVRQAGTPPPAEPAKEKRVAPSAADGKPPASAKVAAVKKNADPLMSLLGAQGDASPSATAEPPKKPAVTAESAKPEEGQAVETKQPPAAAQSGDKPPSAADPAKVPQRPERKAPPAKAETEKKAPVVATEAVAKQPSPDSALMPLGERVEASGNRPFLIDATDTVWLVESGKVEIFTVEVADGQPVGARSHYLSVDPGQGFFSLEPERYGTNSGFLAVGKMGTILRRFTLDQVQQAAQKSEHEVEVARLVDRWVAAMSRRLTKEIIPGPLVDVNLVADSEVSLERNQKARSSKGVLWLEVERGDLLFIGMEELALSTKTLFPVTVDTWIEASDAFGLHTDLTPLTTGSTIARADLWRGLELFHEALCNSEFINKKLAVLDELNRLKSKAEYSSAARTAALTSLAGVLSQDFAEQARLGDSESEPLLLATMRKVGDEQGIPIAAPPQSLKDRKHEDQIALVARTSKIRTRVVALRGDWWKQDQGPILGRWAETEQPVALIPKGVTAYECVDLESQERRVVDDEVAASLNGFGHVLYRAFPDGALKVVDLVKFGVRGLRRDAMGLVIMGILIGILGSLTPYFTGRIFDSAIPEAERGLLMQIVLALVVAAFVTAAFRITQAIAVLRVQGKMDYSIQSALWDRLLNLPSTFFRKYSSGDLATRVAGINAIRDLVAGAGVAAILGAFSSVFYLFLMFWYSRALALVAIFLTVVFVAFTSGANYLQLRYQREQFARGGRIAGLVLQLITGVSKIRVSGAENHAFRVWAEKFAEHRRVQFIIGRIQNGVMVFSSSFPIFSSILIFYVLTVIRSRGEASGVPTTLSTGEFIAFSSAYGLFLTAMQALSTASLGMLQMVPIYERLAPIITTPAEVDETKSFPGKLSGEIELSHVHFRYVEGGPWIIKDVSLTIAPGEFVAFVGSSGSGKSTMMRLMLGFETPEKGSIYYDGQDLQNLDLRAVRQQLGVVLQESRVLPADIFTNIVGTSSRTIEDAWEAARMAGLDEDIREMPMGMHTYVSEGGGGFSGGQRQRLLIARAVVNRPRIMFMDEATSALDNRTQSIVTESLGRLQATRIVIAHRLSTIINADRICYLDAGVIKEIGNYDELMALDGLFAQLALRQMA